MSANGIKGYQNPESGTSDFNAQTFLINSILARCNTTTLVKIVAIHAPAPGEPVGFVDIFPMVNQVDGDGVVVPNAVIYNCCYHRLQGGINAIIIDPVPGDIGIACFASSDISAVQNTRQQSNPGSYRKFDMADGIYLGGVLNGVPTQFVKFDGNGITITSPTVVTINAPALHINADTAFTGHITANGHIIDERHKHSGVTAGLASTGTVST
jgi:hypothetical protein